MKVSYANLFRVDIILIFFSDFYFILYWTNTIWFLSWTCVYGMVTPLAVNCIVDKPQVKDMSIRASSKEIKRGLKAWNLEPDDLNRSPLKDYRCLPQFVNGWNKDYLFSYWFIYITSVIKRFILVVSLFQDPIIYGRFTGATLCVLCFDWGIVIYILFSNILPR